MKKRLYNGLLGLVATGLSLTACSVADPAQQQVPKAPKSVQLSLVSSTNLQDWDIALSPEFNAAIDEWVFNEKIEFLGPAPVQNVVFDVEGANKISIADEKPHQPTQSIGAWIPVDHSTFTVRVSWDVQKKHMTGQAVYAIEKQ